MIRAFVLALGLVAACGKAKDDTPAIAKHQKLLYPVDVAPLVQRQLTFSINSNNAQVTAYTVQITARVAGPVDKVLLEEGKEVKVGESLVAIDRARYKIAVDQANAAYAKAVANAKSADAAYQRREAAEKESPGVIPEEEIEEKRTARDTALADVEAAKQARETAQLNWSYSTVTAPVAGLVQTRTVSEGQYLTAGALLGTIDQHDPIYLDFSILDSEAPRLRRARESGPVTCNFLLDGSTHQYTANITFVADAADPNTRLFHVRAEIISPMKDAKPGDPHALAALRRLRPSTHAVVAIPIGTPRPGIVVPQIAVQPTEKGNVVYTVDKDNVAHQRIVTTGLHTPDGGIELTKGVDVGELLVVNGSDPLSEGVSVAIKNTTTLEAATRPATAQTAQPDDTSVATTGSGSAVAAPVGSAQ